MIFVLLLESMLLGFIMAAPVGPVGILCLQRTLKSGWLAGFTTGLGVVAVDSIYALIACLGSTTVTHFLSAEQSLIRLVGGAVLLVVGFFIYRSNPDAPVSFEKGRHGRHFFSAFFLALTNPLTILSFAAVYFSLNLGRLVGTDPVRIAFFVVGVFLGSALWWAFLSRLALHWKKGLTSSRMKWINRICGIVIAFFGAGSFAALLWPF